MRPATTVRELLEAMVRASLTGAELEQARRLQLSPVAYLLWRTGEQPLPPKRGD